MSQSPDGDFFDPDVIVVQAKYSANAPESQSPDGDFFDPDGLRRMRLGIASSVTVPWRGFF